MVERELSEEEAEIVTAMRTIPRGEIRIVITPDHIDYEVSPRKRTERRIKIGVDKIGKAD